MNKKEYQRKIKLYEKMGALKFQKVVFKIEELKFKFLKKVFPNIIEKYDKFCDRKEKKRLKKAKTEKERRRIKAETKFAKMAVRQEWNEEKNRNYHMNLKRPTEIIGYLEWNKKIHKKGLITNSIVIPILIAGVVLQLPLAAPFLVFECLSAAINFECLNIQNYNLARVERMLPVLKKKEEAHIRKTDEDFGEAAKVIAKSIEKSESLPTFEEILNNIETPEQLSQMRELFKHRIEERQKQKAIGQKTA